MDKPNTTVFCFFDETGLLNTSRDKFFAVGMIKVNKPETLYLDIKNLRDKYHMYDEIKWNKVNKRDHNFYRELLALFMKHKNARFSCYIFRKTDLDIKAHFGGNLYHAYQSFAVMQICANLLPSESAVILMDDLSTPSTVNLEQNIKKKANIKLQRRAVHGVCRIYSQGSELIQLNDLLLGAIVYGLKLESKLIEDPGKAKVNLLNEVKRITKIDKCGQDFRNSKLDIWHFKPKS